MSPLWAAMVLLWVVVILLVFATAGILQKVRQLERRGATAPGPANSDAVATVTPSGGRIVSAVLVVEEGCGVCAEVMPRFSAAASGSEADRVEFVVVSNGAGQSAYKLGADVRLVADRDVHRALEPGWFPAMLIVTADRVIAAVEPAGSPEAIDHLVTRVVERAAELR